MYETPRPFIQPTNLEASAQSLAPVRDGQLRVNCTAASIAGPLGIWSAAEPVDAHWQRCILPCLHSHAGSAVRASAGSQAVPATHHPLHGAVVAQLPAPAVLMGAHLLLRCVGCTSARWRGAWYAQQRQPGTSGTAIPPHSASWVFITQLHIHTMRGNAHTST